MWDGKVEVEHVGTHDGVEIDRLKEAEDANFNKNSTKQTQWAVNLFNKWANRHGEYIIIYILYTIYYILYTIYYILYIIRNNKIHIK